MKGRASILSAIFQKLPGPIWTQSHCVNFNTFLSTYSYVHKKGYIIFDTKDNLLSGRPKCNNNLTLSGGHIHLSAQTRLLMIYNICQTRILLFHKVWEANIFLPVDSLLTLKNFLPTTMPFLTWTQTLGPGPATSQVTNSVDIFFLMIQSQDLITPAYLLRFIYSFIFCFCICSQMSTVPVHSSTSNKLVGPYAKEPRLQGEITFISSEELPPPPAPSWLGTWDFYSLQMLIIYPHVFPLCYHQANYSVDCTSASWSPDLNLANPLRHFG